MEIHDALTKCERCESNLCYSKEINEKIKIQSCLGCGFWTSTLMKEGEQFYEEQMEILPNLYKELAGLSESGKIWVPTYINTNEGMIFANGKNIDDWKWAAVKKIDVTEEEKEKYPIPNKKGKFYKRRTDINTMKEFEKMEYIKALNYLKML